MLRYLADIDPRFSSLVRLVKLWAGAHGMNDAASGTFNSFALTLMVSRCLFTCGWYCPPSPLPYPFSLTTLLALIGQLLCLLCFSHHHV